MDALSLRRPLLKAMEVSGSQQKPNQLLPLDCSRNASPAQHQCQSIKPSTEESYEYLPSPARSAFSMSPPAQSPKPQSFLATTIPHGSATPSGLDLSEQFLYAVSECSSSDYSTSINKEIYPLTGNLYNPAFNLVPFLDTIFHWAPSSVAHPISNMHASMRFDMPVKTCWTLSGRNPGRNLGGSCQARKSR